MVGDARRARTCIVNKLQQITLVIIGCILAGLAGWRVIVTGLADRYAMEAPERSLALEPRNPDAMIALAERQLMKGKPDAAAASARELLRTEPLSGDAYVILAKAAESSGASAKVRALYAIAVRRAPRDLYSRAWMIETLLRDGRYADALEQFDTLFRVSPGQGGKILPLLAQLSDAPAFAQALAAALDSRTAWKAAMLLALLQHGSHDAVDQIFGDLQHKGNLSDDESGRWLDWLMQKGFWGEAYSRWVGGLKLAPGAPLPLLYNGRFEMEPSGIGFDWRMRPAVGVTIEREPTIGAKGSFAIDVGFSGRRVPEIHLEQRLFLWPGEYTLSFRARAQGLHSDKGLEWAIQCLGQNDPLAVSEALDGNFAWKQFETPFVIPDQSCTSQRIWLRNPGAAAAGKEVSGDIWFDDFAIRRAVASL